SITVRASTPSSARHNLTLRTSLPAPLVPDRRQARNLKRQRRAPFHINNAPTEVSEEPYLGRYFDIRAGRRGLPAGIRSSTEFFGRVGVRRRRRWSTTRENW